MTVKKTKKVAKKSEALKILEGYSRAFGVKTPILEDGLDKEEEIVECQDDEVVNEEDDILKDGTIVEDENEDDDQDADLDPENKEDDALEEDDINDAGESEMKPIVEKLISEAFSTDNETQKSAVAELGKLAESDDELANKFMEALDACASCMSVGVNEDNGVSVSFDPAKFEEKFKKKK